MIIGCLLPKCHPTQSDPHYLLFIDNLGYIVKISGDFLAYIVKVSEGPDKGKFVCTICGKTNSQKIHTQNHVESIHFPGTFEYKCRHCGLIFNGRNKLYMHVNQAHKNQKI